MKNIKRIVSFILALVIILGYVDMSSFMSLAYEKLGSSTESLKEIYSVSDLEDIVFHDTKIVTEVEVKQKVFDENSVGVGTDKLELICTALRSDSKRMLDSNVADMVAELERLSPDEVVEIGSAKFDGGAAWLWHSVGLIVYDDSEENYPFKLFVFSYYHNPNKITVISTKTDSFIAFGKSSKNKVMSGAISILSKNINTINDNSGLDTPSRLNKAFDLIKFNGSNGEGFTIGARIRFIQLDTRTNGTLDDAVKKAIKDGDSKLEKVITEVDALNDKSQFYNTAHVKDIKDENGDWIKNADNWSWSSVRVIGGYCEVKVEDGWYQNFLGENANYDVTARILHNASGIGSDLVDELTKKSISLNNDGLSINYSSGNLYGDVYEMIKSQIEEGLNLIRDSLKGAELTKLFVDSNSVDVDSYEELLAYYIHLRLLVEKAKTDGEKSGVEQFISGTSSTVCWIKTTLMEGDKQVILFTSRDMSSSVSADRFMKSEFLQNDYYMVTPKSIMESNKVSKLYTMQIKTEYAFERNRIGVSNKIKSLDILSYDKWYAEQPSALVTVNYNGINTGITAEMTREIMDKYPKESVISILSYISNTYANGAYTLYKGLFGSSDVGEDMYVFDADLDAMASNNFSDIDGVIYVADTMPKTIGALGDDGYKWFSNNRIDDISKNSWYDFIRFLHLTAMGFDAANGLESRTLTTEGLSPGDSVYESTYGYSAQWIRDHASSWTNPNKDEEDFGGDHVAIEMVRAILGLHDLMDYLMIPSDAWTPAIKEYYDLYPILKDYANNKNIKSIHVSVNTIEEPLGAFFSIQGNDMSDNWKLGFALSSTYVPFETNLYDATHVVPVDDDNWVNNFYYKYGFYRKAVYINNDSNVLANQAISNEITTGTRVCTLKDLVEPAGDVILTVDSNFYNADRVSDTISLVDYTTLRSTEASKTGEADENGNVISSAVKGLWNATEDAFDLDATTLLKTDGTAYYSQTVAMNCTHMEDKAEWYDLSAHVYDAYLLSAEDIISTLDDDEYSPKQSYAVVSAIYRSADLYNEMLGCLTSVNGSDNAIFKASKAVSGLTTGDGEYYKPYLNYLMLEGLERQMKNTSHSQLDMNAPVFCDIFGNIVTESGDVIIPASSNVTLAGEEWTPANLGFAILVGGKSFDVGNASEDFKEWLTGRVVVDEATGTRDDSKKYTNHSSGSGWFQPGSLGYILKTTILTDSKGNSLMVNFGSLPVNGGQFKQMVFDHAWNTVCEKKYSDATINNVVEVLRGAPIENIDYAKEKLDNSRTISKMGVYVAYKLEELVNSIYGSDVMNNSMVNYQSIVFMSGIEYIILYIYKVLFAIMLVVLFGTVCINAIKGQLTIKSFFGFGLTLAMLIFCITLVPDLINYSYYRANRDLLSDDVSYLIMLNYAKSFDGNEINVASLDKPSSSSELYIKLEDISFDWFSATTDVLFRNTYNTVAEIYDEAIMNSAIAAQNNVVREGNTLYYLVDQLLEDISISYNQGQKMLSIRSYEDGSVCSYICPYFVLLEYITEQVNTYNNENNIEPMTIGISGGDKAGHVITYDLLTQYFMSDVFHAEGYDITGMHYILQDGSNEILYAGMPFSSPALTGGSVISDIEKMQSSYWWPDRMSDSQKLTVVNKLEDYARTWVTNNRDLFGKVPDEVLLKTYSLVLAIKFNQLCGCPAANSFEIINIDSRDLFRLLVSDKENTYKYFSYGLARYVYECGGAICCIMLGFFVVFDKLIGFFKLAVIIAIIGLLILNCLFRKLIFQKNSKCIEGYLVTCAAVMIINYLYSIMMAIQFAASDWGWSPILVVLFAMVTQIVYMFGMCGIVKIVVKDWKNNGYGEWQNSAIGLTGFFRNMSNKFMEGRTRRRNHAYASAYNTRYHVPRRSGMSMRDMMRRRDEVRLRASQEHDAYYDEYSSYGRGNRYNSSSYNRGSYRPGRVERPVGSYDEYDDVLNEDDFGEVDRF